MTQVSSQHLGGHSLSERLDALAELVRIGRARQGQAGQGQAGQGQAGHGQAGQGQAREEADDGVTAGFSKTLLDDAETVLKRAGERLRLSGQHTVIALAGGTGSGKSTLFNALSGATFSPPGVTRPTTRHVHACVWGMQGAGSLLDWLGVQRRHRYARASVLDSGEADLDGLILLDLPDHDSVVTASMAAVDRLSKLADMVIWVLDPQKYADAAVHNRYLIPLAGHSSVFTVVLNQIDVLPADQGRDCEEDLRRLLDAEGLPETPLLPVSARTGAGLTELRALLTETVTNNRAVTMRIAADIDAMIGGFAVYSGPQVAPDAALAGASWPVPVTGGVPVTGRVPVTVPVPVPVTTVPGTVPVPVTAALSAPLSAPLPEDDDEQAKAPSRPPWDRGGNERFAAVSGPAGARPPWEDATQEGGRRDGADPAASVPAEPARELTDAFARAAGLSAVAQAMASAREAQAARLTGWPVSRLLRAWRLEAGHDPVRVLQSSAGPGAVRQAAPGRNEGAAGPAQQSEVDNAITAFADSVGGELPEPWAGSLREAARCNAGMVPKALAGAVHDAADAGKAAPPGWWRLVTAWQWLLVTLAAAGFALSVVIAIVRLTGHRRGLISEAHLIPWLLIMAIAMLVLGYLTAVGTRNAAVATAERERDAAEHDMRNRVAAVTHDLVLLAAGREVAQYERFRKELAVATA